MYAKYVLSKQFGNAIYTKTRIRSVVINNCASGSRVFVVSAFSVAEWGNDGVLEPLGNCGDCSLAIILNVISGRTKCMSKYHRIIIS